MSRRPCRAAATSRSTSADPLGGTAQRRGERAPDQVGVEQGAGAGQRRRRTSRRRGRWCASPPRRRRAPRPAARAAARAPPAGPSGWWPCRARGRRPRRRRRSARRAGPVARSSTVSISPWTCVEELRTPAGAGRGRGRPARSGGRRRSGSPCRSGCARRWCGAGRGTPRARAPPSPSGRWPRRPAPPGAGDVGGARRARRVPMYSVTTASRMAARRSFRARSSPAASVSRGGVSVAVSWRAWHSSLPSARAGPVGGPGPAAHLGRPAGWRRQSSPRRRAEMKASWGTSTRPMFFIASCPPSASPAACACG